MPSLTIPNIPEELERALVQRAKVNGTSLEAEVLKIIEEGVNPPKRTRIGSELAAFGRKYGGLELDITRDPPASEPAGFE